MYFRRPAQVALVQVVLATAALLFPALSSAADEGEAPGSANGSFVVESVTFEEGNDVGEGVLSSLQASLDRARSNGRLTSMGSRPTLSLEQALRLAEWRRGVAQQLEDVSR